MRVGLFSPTAYRIGGGEWVTFNMAYALERMKHEIMIHSARRICPDHIREFFGRDLHFSEVKLGPTLLEPYSLENIYPNLLKSYLFSLKCDLMIDTFSNDLLPWSDAVYFHGIPRSLRLPEGIEKTLFLPYKAFLNATIKREKTSKKVLMTCSECNARPIREQTGLQVNVLYPPVSDFFRAENLNDTTRSDTVVTVARIAEDKRPETIPQIAKLVTKNFSFVIIGSCRLQQEALVLSRLRKLIRDLGVEKKVKVLLNISRKRQRDILQHSKIYLHPQVPYESFGISVVEAMFAGCIPVVPDIGGLREIVPREQRYASLEEAAALVDESVSDWSQRRIQECVAMAGRFSQARFIEQFLEIMRLQP